MNLENYGFIGNMQTAALVGLNGSIDWLCLPRFDSPACFAAILGDSNHGCWHLAPAAAVHRARQAYRGETMVLETEFETGEGKVRLTDALAVDAPHQLIRVVEGIEGTVTMELLLNLRADYGLTIPWAQKHRDDVVAVAGPNAWILRSDINIQAANRNIAAQFAVSAGKSHTFSLTWHPSHLPAPPPDSVAEKLQHAEHFWRQWARRCTYEGKYRDAVVRSLLTLKALTYAPTGAMVAAPTTSLPEKLGGVRNWDYRYCWLRDATFTMYSLIGSGYTSEAKAWADWLLRAIGGDANQLQIMYGLGAERRLTELTLPHLPGFEGSSPVRIGNAAAEQFQLDVYGEVFDSLHLMRTTRIPLGKHAWRLEIRLLEFVIKNWTQPDEGIWEIRGPRRHFVHSKMMAWLAIDRAVKAVTDLGLEGDAERWSAVRQAIKDDICSRGYNPERKAFTQYYGSEQLDASLLMMPLIGFLPVTDERVRTTIDAIKHDLMTDGLLYRYHPGQSEQVDGLPPGEGAFLPCSFWMVDCLHLLGRTDEAVRLFESLLEKRTPLGLMAEQYDVGHNRLVGNFPQAFTHVGLINSAHNLSKTAAGPATIRSGI